MSGTPVLDRIETWLRAQNRTVSLEEVAEAFPGERAELIRLALGALRKQGVISGFVEEGKPQYMVIAGAQRTDVAPLRKPSERIVVPAAATNAQKVVTAMREGGSIIYSAAEIATIAKLNRPLVVEVLRNLVDKGEVHGRGMTSGRRYSLSPFTTSAPEPVPAAMSAAVLEVARHTEVRREEEEAARQPAQVAATSGASGMTADPRFAYWSDGTLEIDCEDCSGKLRRRDIEALRAFVAVLPALEGG